MRYLVHPMGLGLDDPQGLGGGVRPASKSQISRFLFLILREICEFQDKNIPDLSKNEKKSQNFIT